MSVGAESIRGPAFVSQRVGRVLSVAGILIGILAFWLALPPVASRSLAVPISLGVFAMVLGIAAVTFGDRRAGYGAVAAGVLGIVCGVLAIQAAVSNLEAVILWGPIIAATLRFATPLTFAAIGGLFSERSGVVNIGLEGMMLMGAFFGAWGADVTGSWEGGVLIGMLAGAALAFVHALFSITIRADQIVSGTAVNFLALGITGYLYIDIYSGRAGGGTPNDLPEVPDVNIDWLSSIPPKSLGNFLDAAFGELNLLVWLSFVVVILAWIILFKTPVGLHIRAVGEHPRAADTVGISVYLIRYAAVTASGALAALGGVFLSIGFSHSFTENMTAGRGFIALAALIFGKWRPFGVLGATLLFGFAGSVTPQLENVESWSTYGTLFSALPYLLTLIAVAGVIGRSIPPAAIGRPYQK